MRGPKRVMRCDGMSVTRCISSSTSGGSSAPAGSTREPRSTGKPRLTTPYAGKDRVVDRPAGVEMRLPPRPARCPLPPARKGRAGILRLEPVHHCLNALHVLIADVVLGAQLRRDVNVGDVVTSGRIDAVKRLEEQPVLT